MANDEQETGVRSLTISPYRFTYYPASGGWVITSESGLEVCDAGIISAGGPIDAQTLDRLAHRWLVWQREYRRQKALVNVRIGNRPANPATDLTTM